MTLNTRDDDETNNRFKPTYVPLIDSKKMEFSKGQLIYDNSWKTSPCNWYFSINSFKYNFFKIHKFFFYSQMKWQYTASTHHSITKPGALSSACFFIYSSTYILHRRQLVLSLDSENDQCGRYLTTNCKVSNGSTHRFFKEKPVFMGFSVFNKSEVYGVFFLKYYIFCYFPQRPATTMFCVKFIEQ